MYQSHESIIWACTTSFVHTFIYRMLDVSSHVYVYIWYRHHFICMFSDSDLLIYMYLISDLLPILWFSFILLVIVDTCMPESHHFDPIHVWLPAHLTYSLGCFVTTLDLHVQIQEHGPWWPYCSWSECAVTTQISGCLSGAPFLPAPLISSRDSHLAICEYFLVFYITYHALRFLVI